MAFIPQTKVFITEVRGRTFAASDKSALKIAFPGSEIIAGSFPALVFQPIPAGEYWEVFPDRISKAYLKHPLSQIPG